MQFERDDEQQYLKLEGDIFDASSIQLSGIDSKEELVVRFFSETQALERRLPGEKLRFWHPKLGKPLTDDSVVVTKSSPAKQGCSSGNNKSKSGLFPCRLEKKGKYGYLVEWADGTTVIYSMSSLAASVGAEICDKAQNVPTK